MAVEGLAWMLIGGCVASCWCVVEGCFRSDRSGCLRVCRYFLYCRLGLSLQRCRYPVGLVRLGGRVVWVHRHDHALPDLVRWDHRLFGEKAWGSSRSSLW
jgi:hypothetical protein